MGAQSSDAAVGFHQALFPAQSAQTALGASLTQHCFFQFSTMSFMDESVFGVSFLDGGVEAQLSEQGIWEPANLRVCEVLAREQSLPRTRARLEEFQDGNASLRQTLCFSYWCTDVRCHKLGFFSDPDSNYRKQNPLPQLANDFNISWRNSTWT